jgi:hypothetical protein
MAEHEGGSQAAPFVWLARLVMRGTSCWRVGNAASPLRAAIANATNDIPTTILIG